MDYAQSFAISSSGMAVEKARLDVIALNLANLNSTRGTDGAAYQPLRLVSGEKSGGLGFGALMQGYSAPAGGAEIREIRALAVPPRLVYEPAHPDADEKGFVAYPGVNQVSEMVNLMAAVRAYEANVVAMSAARSMALKTLEFGAK